MTNNSQQLLSIDIMASNKLNDKEIQINVCVCMSVRVYVDWLIDLCIMFVPL